MKDRTEELSHEDRNIQAIKLNSEAALQKNNVVCQCKRCMAVSMRKILARPQGP